jgi:hypothetical protein
MSLPCPGHPKYKICNEEKIRASLCPGKIIAGAPVFTCNIDERVEVADYSSTHALLDYPLDLKADYKITNDGICINVSGEGKILHMLPAFAFDGEKETDIALDNNVLQIEYEGSKCRYTSNGVIKELGKTARNRNGFYRLFYAEGDNTLDVKIEII